jgi:hypothetical protein
MTSSQAELGTDTELLALVERVKGFGFEAATMNENSALVKALKIIAEDTTKKWVEVNELKRALGEKLDAAGVAAELAGVVASMRPAKRRSWWSRG